MVEMKEQLKPQLEGKEISQKKEDFQQGGEKERSFEVESVIEKLERQTKADQQQQDVSDDLSNTVVVASDDQPGVTLPVTKNDIVQGQKLSVWESLRWLAEWAWRQVKKFSGRVRYQEEK